jgi:hypothetical protein
LGHRKAQSVTCDDIENLIVYAQTEGRKRGGKTSTRTRPLSPSAGPVCWSTGERGCRTLPVDDVAVAALKALRDLQQIEAIDAIRPTLGPGSRWPTNSASR